MFIEIQCQHVSYVWYWTQFTNKCIIFYWLLRRLKAGGEGDEMVGWHHRLNLHEFEQSLGVGDGQGSLVCCSPWGCKELDTTEWLNWTEHVTIFPFSCMILYFCIIYWKLLYTQNLQLPMSSSILHSVVYDQKDIKKTQKPIWRGSH